MGSGLARCLARVMYWGQVVASRCGAFIPPVCLRSPHFEKRSLVNFSSFRSPAVWDGRVVSLSGGMSCRMGYQASSGIAERALNPVLPPSANAPSHTCQLPARQYTRHVPFWQIGNELPQNY